MLNKSLSRNLDLTLPNGKSAFLFGSRKIGKSTFLKKNFSKSLYYNLLDQNLYFELVKNPSKLRAELLALKLKKDKRLKQPIIIDEIQKIPALLDEVHLLIEDHDLTFILCGSSARKLKNSAVNMLGGRAWSYKFFPFNSAELKANQNWDLLKALKQGLIPDHYLEDQKYWLKNLQSYVETYLKEEIKAESLTRNLIAFSRFLDSIAFSHAELTNYSNIARDCGIDSKTVKEYYQILIDTLLGDYIYPYNNRKGRDAIKSTPKFYLFDVGLANYLCQLEFNSLKGADAGKALEHFIWMELRAYLAYEELDYEIKFWRSKSGLEVDFILTSLKSIKLVVETKISANINKKELTGTLAFLSENPEVKLAYIVCLENKPRLISSPGGDILITPVNEFLDDLWAGRVTS
jgi:predicted AAA+ superfamily ATPase